MVDDTDTDNNHDADGTITSKKERTGSFFRRRAPVSAKSGKVLTRSAPRCASVRPCVSDESPLAVTGEAATKLEGGEGGGRLDGVRQFDHSPPLCRGAPLDAPGSMLAVTRLGSVGT